MLPAVPIPQDVLCMFLSPQTVAGDFLGGRGYVFKLDMFFNI